MLLGRKKLNNAIDSLQLGRSRTEVCPRLLQRRSNELVVALEGVSQVGGKGPLFKPNFMRIDRLDVIFRINESKRGPFYRFDFSDKFGVRSDSWVLIPGHSCGNIMAHRENPSLSKSPTVRSMMRVVLTSKTAVMNGSCLKK